MATAAKLNIESYKRTAQKTRLSSRRSISERVVNLFQGPKAKEAELLSASEREQLVVDFRLKARKLARSILRRWHARLDLQEVDSIVDLSLCEAVKRYDPSKGASFMTFLFYHLRGNLIRAVSAAALANIVPVADIESEQDITNHRNGSQSGANAIDVAEALCSQDGMLPDELLFKKELVDLSEQACSKLDALEREVIERIYIKEEQLMDIASSLGYSRCHISRVKKKALETLFEELSVAIAKEDKSKHLDIPLGWYAERRKIHRRKPRSQKTRSGRTHPGDKKISVAA